MTDPVQFSGIVPPTAPASGSGAVGGTGSADPKDFKSVLLDSLDEVNRLQKEADHGVQQLLTGETDNVSEVLAAVNKAGIAFDLLMEIRNKLTEAYQEIRQMQV